MKLSVRGLAMLLALVGLVISGTPAVAQSSVEQHDTTPERKRMADFLWESAPAPRGMITISYAAASDSAGPSTQGLRVGYGYLGGKANDYPWGEFWGTFRKDGRYDITAAGLSVVPIAKLHRRFGVGPLFDLGVSRRREDGRTVFAGMFGVGAEGVVRISRQWDVVTTAEAVYRTTSDTEFQARIGIRFHHEKIPIHRGEH